MSKIRFVGLDVHAETIAVAVAEPNGEVRSLGFIANRPESIRRLGKVASTHFAGGSKGQPTFLNLDEPYPKEIFTILIWGSDRAKFGTPETKYRDAQVCVNGKIELYRGVPEIIDYCDGAEPACFTRIVTGK
jgi:hypothetical protein